MAVKQIDEVEHRRLLNSVWKNKFDLSECFPVQIKDWIVLNSTLLGVPTTYLAWPLLVASSYCAQHSIVSANDFHIEPILLYGLVVGRSGKNVT